MLINDRQLGTFLLILSHLGWSNQVKEFDFIELNIYNVTLN